MARSKPVTINELSALGDDCQHLRSRLSDIAKRLSEHRPDDDTKRAMTATLAEFYVGLSRDAGDMTASVLRALTLAEYERELTARLAKSA